MRRPGADCSWRCAPRVLRSRIANIDRQPRPVGEGRRRSAPARRRELLSSTARRCVGYDGRCRTSASCACDRVEAEPGRTLRSTPVPRRRRERSAGSALARCRFGSRDSAPAPAATNNPSSSGRPAHCRNRRIFGPAFRRYWSARGHAPRVADSTADDEEPRCRGRAEEHRGRVLPMARIGRVPIWTRGKSQRPRLLPGPGYVRWR